MVFQARNEVALPQRAAVEVERKRNSGYNLEKELRGLADQGGE